MTTDYKNSTKLLSLRIPTKTYVATRERAFTTGESMTSIVVDIVNDYLAAPDLGTNYRTPHGETPKLPKETEKILKKLEDDTVLFNAYLAALNKAGWSLRSLAGSLPFSHASVRLRVQKGANDCEMDGLPPVPERSPHQRPPKSDELNASHTSVRLPTKLMEDLQKKSRAEGAHIAAIINAGLATYVSKKRGSRARK